MRKIFQLDDLGRAWFIGGGTRKHGCQEGAMLCYGKNSSSLGQNRTRTSHRYEDATVTARPVPRGGQLELYIPQGRLLKQADIA